MFEGDRFAIAQRRMSPRRPPSAFGLRLTKMTKKMVIHEGLVADARTHVRTYARTDTQLKNDAKNPDTNGETSLKKSHFDAFLAVSDNFSVTQKGGSFEHFLPLPRPIFMAKKQVKIASIIDFK